ncbi:MAG: phosphotransferase [Nocardioidaceae bacterium]
MSAGPRGLDDLPTIPHGATARRLDWLLLPPAVRALVEDRLGGPVVRADSAGAGYTPGCASVLTTADGAQVFLKAASRRAQRPFAAAYAQEAAQLARLQPGRAPVPRLLWSHQDDLWVLLALEHVTGRNPARPWTESELDRCLDCLESLAEQLTPPPMPLPTFGDEHASLVAGWDHVRRVAPDWPHLEEAAALAARQARATAGRTVVHTDARDDNFLLPASGGALLCDWNYPVRGAAWIDTVCLLLTAYGDGVDADALLVRRALTRDVDPERIDVLLALLCGYFLERRDQPAPYPSPHLRRIQDWSAEVSWAWLARRRGWD